MPDEDEYTIIPEEQQEPPKVAIFGIEHVVDSMIGKSKINMLEFLSSELEVVFGIHYMHLNWTGSFEDFEALSDIERVEWDLKVKKFTLNRIKEINDIHDSIKKNNVNLANLGKVEEKAVVIDEMEQLQMAFAKVITYIRDQGGKCQCPNCKKVGESND